VRENYYLRVWERTPLPVVQIRHEELNPFIKDGVEMHAILGYHLPYDTMKFLAALGLLWDAAKKGMLVNVRELVEATSGAFGFALTNLALAHPFGMCCVNLVIKEDVSLGKRMPPFFAGANIISPEEGLSPIATARKLGGGGWKPNGEWKSDNGVLNLDQYANPANCDLYRNWAVTQTLRQVPDVNVFVGPIGTGGTICGFSEGLRQRLGRKNVTIVGVMCAPGVEAPGVRDLNGMKEISQPWREAIDERIEVEKDLAYLSTLSFQWFMGLAPGISSGLAYAGSLISLKRHKDAGTLDSLRDRNDGKIRVAILFHDNSRPYVADRFPNLRYDFQKPSTAPLPWRLLCEKHP
jgi:cysteine synthase